MRKQGYTGWMVIFIALVACNLGTAPGDAVPEVEIRASPIPPPATPLPQDLTQTHIDDVLRFAFAYPQDWLIEARPGAFIAVTSPLPADYTPPPFGPERPDVIASRVEFIIPEIDQIGTFDEAVAETRGLLGTGVLNDSLIDIGAGWRAVRFDIDTRNDGITAPTAVTIVAEFSGRVLTIYGTGDLARFDQILATVRAVP